MLNCFSLLPHPALPEAPALWLPAKIPMTRHDLGPKKAKTSAVKVPSFNWSEAEVQRKPTSKLSVPSPAQGGPVSSDRQEHRAHSTQARCAHCSLSQPIVVGGNKLSPLIFWHASACVSAVVSYSTVFMFGCAYSLSRWRSDPH